MKRFLRSEAGAAVLWVISALILAAIICPWVYAGGKWLAANAVTHELPRFLIWLGKKCNSADFGRFYNRCLMGCALLLLPLLFRRVRRIRAREKVIIVHAPPIPWQQALLQFVVALIIAGGILWALGAILYSVGAYKIHPKSPGLFKALKEVLPTSLVAACLEEWLFRGVMLGLWLRFAKPLAACLGCSLVFAFLHFMEPPEGMVIADPTAFTAGFELLRSILFHFTDPLFFVTDFATLFLVGLILAGARLRTGHLWFSIGLHTGWIMAYQGFGKLYKPISAHPLRPWGAGESLRSGILPLFALALTALACHYVLKYFQSQVNRA